MFPSALNAHFLAFIEKACQPLLYRTAFGAFLDNCPLFTVLVRSELVWILSPLPINYYFIKDKWGGMEQRMWVSSFSSLISPDSTEGGCLESRRKSWDGLARHREKKATPSSWASDYSTMASNLWGCVFPSVHIPPPLCWVALLPLLPEGSIRVFELKLEYLNLKRSFGFSTCETGALRSWVKHHKPHQALMPGLFLIIWSV